MDEKKPYTVIAEYIWLGGTGELRSKTKIFSCDKFVDADQYHIDNYPNWNYDGSSTGQAEGTYSEVVLRPCTIYKNPFHIKKTNANITTSVLVLCDTYDKDGNPLPTNTRHNAAKTFSSEKATEEKPWFGLEQEYFLFPLSPDTMRRYHGPNGEIRSQGDFYCSVGATKAYNRAIAEDHMFACIDAGLNISGINAEVAPGQWEYQIGPCEGIKSGDQLWISRWLMERITEKYGVEVAWHPKPLEGFNGSGCHTNYSTLSMRGGGKQTNGKIDVTENGIQYIFDAIRNLAANHKEHMKVYGEDNEKRMSGEYETANFDNFTFDINKSVDRGASIRIGYDTLNKQEGYFEDRRPASNMDPYLVTEKIFTTTVVDIPRTASQ